MSIGRFRKTPTERKRYTLDYNNWLDSGETVATRSFTVSPTTLPALYVNGDGLLPGNTQLSFYVNEGVDQTDYTITVTVNTSASQVKQDTLIINVRA